MRNLKIDLENCYGIKKLNAELNFSHRTFVIYAPNGVMKTSFAKTFIDIYEGNETKDLVFSDRKTLRNIQVDGVDITSKKIFVIESYKEDFKSDKVSTLLANKDLREDYEKIHKDIDNAKDALFKELKKLSGVAKKGDPIGAVILEIFGKDISELIFDIKDSVLSGNENFLSKIKYSSIFNPKSIEFLKSSEFKVLLKEYIEKYDELIDKSPILSREFNPYNLSTVSEQLSKNNFFKVGHSVNLFDGTSKTEYLDDSTITKLIESEKDRIISNVYLREKLDEIGDKLSANKDLQNLRDYLLNNKDILVELDNLDLLSKNLWLSYFIEQKVAFRNLLEKYELGKDEIAKLLERARKEKTQWEDVIRIFNSRFSHLPFDIEIANREDVILKGSIETIEFKFKEPSAKPVTVDRETLLKVLSTGEKRALYILNIIFEVEAKKKAQEDVLFIIDDVADSFDYKNKYAIIEYLKYMSEIDCFRMIILTHNFDFYRTIQSRGVSGYSQCLISIKNETGVELMQMTGIRNPFINDWKNNLVDKKKLVASIPFIRNLIEYKDGDSHKDYIVLTSVLHMKSITNGIKLKEIGEIFSRTVNGISFPAQYLDSNVIEFIFEAADDCLNAPEGINLENKIVLSIAIRLKAETFMKSKIKNQEELDSIEVDLNQTWHLIRAYEEEFNNEKDNIEILKRVNLITPENIHVNSFMYEPILDMGDGELRGLYSDVKDKLK